MNKLTKTMLAGVLAATFLAVSQPSMAKRYASSKRYSSSYSKRYLPARTQTNSAYSSSSQYNSANSRNYQSQYSNTSNNNRTATQSATQSNLRSNLLSGAAGVAGGYLLSQALTDHNGNSAPAGYGSQAMPAADPSAVMQQALNALQQSTQALFKTGKLSRDELDSIEFYRSKIENVVTPHLNK